MRVLRLLFLACGLVPMPASAAPKVALSGDIYVLNVTVDGNGVVSVATMLREVEGRVAVCGAVWIGKPSPTAQAQRRNVMRELMVTVKGRTLNVNGSGFAVYDTQAEAERGHATCAVTRQPWTPGLERTEIQLKLRNTTYRG